MVEAVLDADVKAQKNKQLAPGLKKYLAHLAKDKEIDRTLAVIIEAAYEM